MAVPQNIIDSFTGIVDPNSTQPWQEAVDIASNWVKKLVPGAIRKGDLGGEKVFTNGLRVYTNKFTPEEMKTLMSAGRGPVAVREGGNTWAYIPTGGGNYRKENLTPSRGSYLNAILGTAGMWGAGLGLGALGNAVTAVGGAAGAGGFSASELANLGLTAADFAPGGIAGGIAGGGAVAGTTVADLVLQGIPYEEAVNIVGAGTGAGAGVGVGAGEVNAGTAAGTGIGGTDIATGAGTTTIKEALLKKLKDGDPWTTQEKLLAASLGITALGTAAGMLDIGGRTTSATTTTSNLPPYIQEAGKLTWDQFTDDFYGVGTKGVKERGIEDIAAQVGYEQELLDRLGGLDVSHLAATKTAVAPFQAQLSDIQGQLQGGTGLGTPVSFGFGGKKMASFVPKSNRALAEQLLGMGYTSSQINTTLADLAYNADRAQAERKFGFDVAHPPNQAANEYSQRLFDLMKLTNLGNEVSTTTGTVPGVPWYSTLMQGANTAVNFYDKIMNPRTNTGLTADQYQALLKAAGG